MTLPNFEILIGVKSLHGMQQTACFSLGNDKEFASSLFDNLSGIREPGDDALLVMELVQKKENYLPRTLGTIGCTLNECMANCKIITRDVFKLLTLNQDA